MRSVVNFKCVVINNSSAPADERGRGEAAQRETKRLWEDGAPRGSRFGSISLSFYASRVRRRAPPAQTPLWRKNCVTQLRRQHPSFVSEHRVVSHFGIMERKIRIKLDRQSNGNVDSTIMTSCAMANRRKALKNFEEANNRSPRAVLAEDSVIRFLCGPHELEEDCDWEFPRGLRVSSKLT
ncbi:hypothetical protein EVAR_60335_1 [Eumeta japonica]|uniref:Uncharacterized protein n=1 Tax=Eumeta variegata TaxID=151549 RepID=A0A4C1Z4V4_EUMVA|nr:hypothetical protein EVAR_60335_1 [Eumeta japonica]